MKKLIILVSLIALLASGMVFAQVTVSGQVEYGILSDFDKAPGQHWDHQLRFDAKIDEFNSAVIRFRARQGEGYDNPFADPPTGYYNFPGAETSDAPLIDRFFVSTDVLGALGVKGVPVKWVSTNGVNWFQTIETTAGVSPYAVARVSRIAGGNKQPGLQNRFTFADMLTLGVTILPNDMVAGAGGYWFEAYTAALPVGPGKLTAEFNYGTTAGEAFDKANITGGAKYLMPMGDLSLGFAGNFLMAMDSDKAVGYQYGAAFSVAHPMATVKAGFVGMEESEFNAVEVQLLLTPVKQFGIEVGMVLAMDDEAPVAMAKSPYGSPAPFTVGEDMLNELDVSLFVKAGKNTMRLGYLLVSEDNGARSLINSELSRVGRGQSALNKGGMYFEVSCPF